VSCWCSWRAILLKAAGYLAGDVFGWFWPICVILAGVWILLGGSRSRAAGRSMQTFTVPLQGAREASLQINHGVGRMELRAGASTDQFLKGTSALAMNLNSKLAGQRLEVAIDAGPSVFPSSDRRTAFGPTCSIKESHNALHPRRGQSP